MATWQMYLSLERRCKEKLLSNTVFNQTVKEICAHFPEEKSWCKHIRQYGRIDSTCIEISSYDGIFIDEITVRIDLRECTLPQIKCICTFATSNNLVFAQDNVIYDATVDTLLLLARNSSAYKFVEDPQKFLEQINKTGES